MKNNKPILMIHEFLPEFYKMKDTLKDYVLTFDDGLISQYKALEFLKTISTEKIFFISTNIIRPFDKEGSNEVTACAEAHINAQCGDYTDYMSMPEIKEIQNTPFCSIGGHGHDHLKLWKIKGLRERFTALNQDTKKMFSIFKENEIQINDFCFPYNYEDALYSSIINKKKKHTIYGKGRLAIEELM